MTGQAGYLLMTHFARRRKTLAQENKRRLITMRRKKLACDFFPLLLVL
jgi:hypothetical protein